ncbi:MAG: hypothetical protein RMJ84_07225 [Sandaracinaceae bacterium]|nr:hypothetical protein [Sandaracinaceae bacterium]
MKEKARIERVFALCAIGLASFGCGAMGGQAALGGRVATGVSGGASGEAGGLSSCNRNFGAGESAARLKAFVDAAMRFEEAVNEAQAQLIQGCRNTGLALGMSEAELGGDVREVCERVKLRFSEELRALRARYTVKIEAQPPRCEVSVDAYSRCIAECEARVDPGQIELQCEGGEIRGYCDAECRGSCAVEVSGSCGGNCEGICEGRCSMRAADGSCAGRCEGRCEGRCVVSGQANCRGECRGGCSVKYREPYCTGHVRPPQASAQCRASCDARLEAEARCTKGKLRVSGEGGLDPEQQARLNRIDRAMREGVSQILAIKERAQRLRESAEEVVRLAPGVPGAVASLGMQAGACAASAASAFAQAFASVSVTVDVSVSFSAVATAG